MNQSEHTYFNDEQLNMNGIDIQSLIASRLEDLADRVEVLYSLGNYSEAELLRKEGLQLAEAYDSETTFLFVNDLTEVA